MRITALPIVLSVSLVALPATAQRRHPRGTPSSGAPATTSAPPAESADETAAREHFERGVALVEQTRWADAVVELEAARALRAVPPVLYNLGIAHRALGHNLAAIDAFQAFLTASAGGPASARQAEVLAFVGELRAAVGHLRLQLTPANASVLIDGAAPAAGTTDVDVDPGTHVIAVSAARYRSRQDRVEVPRGGTVNYTARLDRADVIQSGPPVAPIAVMGVGVLGLAAGAVFAVVRANAFATFEQAHCNLPPDPQGTIHCEPVPLAPDGRPSDSNYRLGLTMGTASVAAFIGGGVVLAGGAVWLVAALRSRGPREQNAAAVQWTPLVAPDFVGVQGRF